MKAIASGAWWTPDLPDLRIPGTLYRTAEGWRLDLVGTLMVNVGGGDGLALEPLQAIHGTCLGVSYSLQDCFLLSAPAPTEFGLRTAAEDTQHADQHQMIWHVTTVLTGTNNSADALYAGASFEITGLSQWWPSSGLRGLGAVPSSRSYVEPEPLIATCSDGLTVTVGVRTKRRGGHRMRSIAETVTIWVTHEDGFTQETLYERAIAPLRTLLAIALDQPAEVFGLQLQSLDGGGPPTYGIRVDPVDASTEEQLRTRQVFAPVFTARSFDMSVFIPQWLDLARTCRIPMDEAEPRVSAAQLQTQVVQTVSAAETLHRILHPVETAAPAQLPDLAERAAEALRATGDFNSREVRKVRAALSYTAVTLEARLRELAEELGEGVADWLCDGRVGVWAFVAMHVRNILAHGYAKNHDVEKDPAALLAILHVTQAILRLRLLVAAGAPSNADLLRLLQAHRGYSGIAGQALVDWDDLNARIQAG
ncbi:hypothetical protein PV318_00165 [Streptomyces sp. ME02-6991-2B]|nr:hypothetical protein [Streptomyces sp. ME02-6991-2B]